MTMRLIPGCINGKVFIIILNWNGKDDTIECLSSVYKIEYHDFAVVVVDNGSTDKSTETIRNIFPQTTIIENKANLGFAGGNNIGIRYALERRADFILLLNNDTITDPNILTELIIAYKALQNPGFLGCKIYFYDRPETIQYFGGDYSHDHILKGFHVGEDERDDGRFNYIAETGYVTGCAMFTHRSLIDTIGLLDERFFLYWEDGDWCLRARAAGFKHYVVPGAKLWHKVSASNKNGSSVNVFYTSRNRFLFAKKHGFQLRPLYWSYILIHDVLKTRWDQRFSAVYYILLGHIFALLGIYGRMPKALDRNIIGSAERKVHNILKGCKNFLRQFFAC